MRAGGPRLPVDAVREEPVARRQGGRADEARLPLRHGADHPHHPVGAAPHLRRGRPATSTTTSTSSASTRSGGASSPTAASLDLVDDVDAMADDARRASPRARAGDGYRDFLALSERLHHISDRFFFWKSIGGIGDMIDLKAGFSPPILGDVLSMRMGRSVAGTVRKFVPDARVAQMLDHFTQYVGSCPDASPAVLCGIAHMQTQRGHLVSARRHAGRPGGARAKLGEELGVEFRTETRRRAHPDRRRRRRVYAASRPTPARVIELAAVVSNADSVRTHRELLDETAPRAAQRFEQPPQLRAGLLRRRAVPRAEQGVRPPAAPRLRLLARPARGVRLHLPQGRAGPGPDVLPRVHRRAPSPTIAPPGGEALYVLVHTPYLRPHHDWKRMLPEYRRVILDKLKTTGQMPDIEDRIVFESALTPQDIHDRYRVLNGAIYGLASHGKWLGAFKPANRSPRRDGAVPRRRRGPPRARDADGADVRLDRRRRARPGRGRAEVVPCTRMHERRRPHVAWHLSPKSRHASRPHSTARCRLAAPLAVADSRRSAGTRAATSASTSTPCGCRSPAPRSRRRRRAAARRAEPPVVVGSDDRHRAESRCSPTATSSPRSTPRR